MNFCFANFKNSLCVFAREFLSLLYKENCIICGAPVKENAIPLKGVQNLCKNCLKNVKILSYFPHTKINNVEIYSACFYEGTIKQLIHKLKFNHKKEVAKILALFLYEFYKKNEGFKNLVLVPVPTNKNNIKQRGYNNVFEIVKELSLFLNVSYSKKLLLKVKNTKPQYKLTPKKRRENVSGCFKINFEEYKKLEGKTFLIVDDIFTTGATLNEIIKTFKESNIQNLFCITLSKAV